MGSVAVQRKGVALVPENPGQEGRKKSEKWERAAVQAREAARYAVAIAKFAKNVADVIVILHRHF